LTLGPLRRVTTDLDHVDAIMLPMPERCARLEPDAHPERDLAVLEHLELRLPPEASTLLSGRADGSFAIRGWARSADGAPPDPLVCLALLDAFPPVSYTFGRYGSAPTLHATTYMRNRAAPGWVRGERRGRALVDGYFDEVVTLRDATGVLVAQSQRMALFPPSEKQRRR
jgi:hypothetical protein